MKAALNFVPQLSTLDGWWAEGFNGENGWALPLAEGSDSEVDASDHDALFTMLEREIVPSFYERDEHGIPRAWVKRMKWAAYVAGLSFTTRRMVQDYTRNYYVDALRGSAERDDPPTDLIRVVQTKGGSQSE